MFVWIKDFLAFISFAVLFSSIRGDSQSIVSSWSNHLVCSVFRHVVPKLSHRWYPSTTILFMTLWRVPLLHYCVRVPSRVCHYLKSMTVLRNNSCSNYEWNYNYVANVCFFIWYNFVSVRIAPPSEILVWRIFAP